MASLPQLQELHDELETMDDAELLLVHSSTNFGTYDSAQALLDSRGFSMPVVEEGRPIAVLYEIRGFPTLVLVDQDGTVVYKKYSRLTSDRQREDLMARIRELRGG